MKQTSGITMTATVQVTPQPKTRDPLKGSAVWLLEDLCPVVVGVLCVVFINDLFVVSVNVEVVDCLVVGSLVVSSLVVGGLLVVVCVVVGSLVVDCVVVGFEVVGGEGVDVVSKKENYD
jgi:hypothetical protein